MTVLALGDTYTGLDGAPIHDLYADGRRIGSIHEHVTTCSCVDRPPRPHWVEVCGHLDGWRHVTHADAAVQELAIHAKEHQR